MKAGITVVIPSHNHARFLPAAVGSARAQGWPGLEILVVDDGSTDDTARVLGGLAGGDLRVISQPRAGAAAARNRGIEQGRGEWVAFLDADDYWLPGKLAAQMRALEQAAGGGAFAYCGSLVVDAEGRTLATRRAAPWEASPDALVWGNRLAASAMVVSRSALLSVGLFDESLDALGEDWEMWLRLTSRYGGVCVPGPHVAIRRSTFHGKYRVGDFERATLRVVSRFFESLRGRREFAPLARREGRVLSWHNSVLAKNYLEGGEVRNFLRCAARCVRAAPFRGCYYLAPGSVFGFRFKGTPGFNRG